MRALFLIFLSSCVIIGLPRMLWAGASTSVLPPDIQYLGETTAYLRLQPGEDLAPQQLISPQVAARFQPSSRQYPNFGPDTGGYWYRFSLFNPSALIVERVLHLGLRTDHRLFVHNPAQGDWKEIPAWKEEGWDLTFFLTLAPGETADYYAYVRFPNPDGHFVRLELMDQEHYWQKEIFEHGVAFFFYGAIVIMAGYNLFLFLGLRDLSYLYYVIFVLSSGLFQAAFDGIGVNYLWPLLENSPNAARLSALFIVFGCLLTMRLFSTRQHTPRWHRVLVGFAVAAGALFLLGSLTSVGFWIDLAYGIGLLLPLVFLTTGFLSFRRVPRTATLFLFGWSSYTLSVSFLMLIMLGLVPGNIDLEHGAYAAKWGGLIEVTLFALALADRINQLRREKLQAQAELFAKEQETSQRLEGMVAERTALLNQTMQDLASKNQLIEERNAALAEKSLQLQDTIAMKNKFFSIIAHDLRGPIGSMVVVLQLVKDGVIQYNDQLRDHFLFSLSNIRNLLEDLLSWSGSQQGKLKAQPIAFGLDRPASEAITLLGDQATQKQVTLINQVSPFPVLADPAMVKTVVRNLVSNAIKFTRPGGSVTLKSQEVDGHCRFEVQDTGIGIPQNRQRNLFELRRGTTSCNGTHGERGNGLGLILAKEFIDANEGQIGVSSTEGEGSLFWFSLPRAAGLQPDDQWGMAIKEKRILVVEDNPLHQKSCEHVLEGLGCKFALAQNGEEALEKAGKQDFDLILMDIDLPKMNGIETTNAIRRLGKSAKIIALTGYSQTDLELKFGISPFDGYLTKPLNRDSLLAEIPEFFAPSNEPKSTKLPG